MIYFGIDTQNLGDHVGKYCGNPLGCAVAYAVIKDAVKDATKVSEAVEHTRSRKSGYKRVGEGIPEKRYQKLHDFIRQECAHKFEPTI